MGGSDGRTLVTLRVRGLVPNTTYPTHVHNQPCSATPPGGSHYQHTLGGPVDAVNEIWPTIETNRRGAGAAFVVHGERARGDAQSIVIHYPPDTSIRLACVDLR
jgi:Cu-Zn family superoxide dismutase